jgi:mycothiol synthase
VRRVNVRPLTDEDLPAIAALAAADEEVLNGRPSHIEAADVAGWTQLADRERDSWLFEEDGEVAAVGWFNRWGELGAGAGIVGQGWKGRGLGAEIVDRIEAAARREQAQRVHVFARAADAAAARLLEARGFAEVRRFYEMAIELKEPPVVPQLPPQLALEPFGEADARAFHAALDDAFQDHWEWSSQPYDEWWQRRHEQWCDEEGPLWFVVRDGEELAAVVRNESRSTGGYVGALGVRRPWRGRGLAKALLLHTFAEFWRRGRKRVSLGVDAESPTGATHLYERVGMEVESVNLTFEKTLA